MLLKKSNLNKMNKIVIILIFLLFNFYKGNMLKAQQIHLIQSDDTLNNYIHKKERTLFYGESRFEFNDSLPDGIWYFFKKNEIKNSITIYEMASYKNYLKNGMFSEYLIFKPNKKDLNRAEFELVSSSFYIDDTLNGLIYNRKKLSYYENGLHNGIEYQYYTNTNKPEYVRLFRHDTLISWQYFSEKGFIVLYAYNNLKTKMSEFYFYNSDMELEKIIYFRGKNIIKSIEYKKGVIAKETFYEINNNKKTFYFISDINILLQLINDNTIKREIRYDLSNKIKNIFEYDKGNLIDKHQETINK